MNPRYVLLLLLIGLASVLLTGKSPTSAQGFGWPTNPLGVSRCYTTEMHEFPTGEGNSPLSDLIMTSDRAGFRFQATSYSCDLGAYFVTIIPERSLPDAPVVCGSNFRFREANGQAYPAWLIASGLTHVGEEVCGPVYLPVTRQFRYSLASGRQMQYTRREPVELSYVADNGNQATVRFPSASQKTWISDIWKFLHGTSSGLFWGGERRSGEGLIVTVEQSSPWQVNPVVFFALFTFDQLGDPMWLVANYHMDRSDTLIYTRTPLGRVTGRGFGDSFDPASVERTAVADIEVLEYACGAKEFRIFGRPGWEWLSFWQTGQQMWVRLLGSFEYTCRTSMWETHVSWNRWGD